MKTIKSKLLAQILTSILMVIGVTSCYQSEDFSYVNPDYAEPEQILEDPVSLPTVRTFAPVIAGTAADFQGAIESLEGADLANYGFMWYIPVEIGDVEVHRVEVGQTAEAIQFSQEMTDLPRGTSLVVCAYAANSDGAEAIGDEVGFELPK